MEALAQELKEPKYGEYYLCQSVNHPYPYVGVISPRTMFRGSSLQAGLIECLH